MKASEEYMQLITMATSQQVFIAYLFKALVIALFIIVIIHGLRLIREDLND